MDLSKSYDFFKPEKNKGRIHIVGCGSVGATIAELLVRAGVTKITLWDFDKVESRNLANQIFRHKDIGQLKTEALKDILLEINPEAIDDIVLKSDGWKNNNLSGYIFLCVDNIELRKEIVIKNMTNGNIKAMFDFRTGLVDAQHYAADWNNDALKENFLNSMNFSHEEAMQETPMSACNVTLSVAPTVRNICSIGVANFMNFWNDKPIKKFILCDSFNFTLDAF